MTEPLDAAQHDPIHGGPSFSLANRAERASFAVVWRLAAWLLPPPLGWGWRRLLLRMFGAQIGSNARIYPTARIWLPRNLVMEAWSSIGPGVQCYNQARITLGAGAIVSQRASLCAGDHDHRDPAHQLVTRPILIGARAWIAAEAFVGPGVAIGSGAVLGARGCAMKDIPAETVWAGNPAQQIAVRQLG
jgi:putative colanic acid biosynthesis acetyltransferase WcaF